jgi:hypothetical protein
MTAYPTPYKVDGSDKSNGLIDPIKWRSLEQKSSLTLRSSQRKYRQKFINGNSNAALANLYIAVLLLHVLHHVVPLVPDQVRNISSF